MIKTWVGWLNFLVLQWLGLRIAEVRVRTHANDYAHGYYETSYRHVGWSLIRWVWPLTGWWSPYRWIARRGWWVR